jgi:hypothetical protein
MMVLVFFFHIFTNDLFLLLLFFLPNGCEVSHFGADLHFLKDEWCWASFYMFIGNLYVLFEKKFI